MSCVCIKEAFQEIRKHCLKRRWYNVEKTFKGKISKNTTFWHCCNVAPLLLQRYFLTLPQRCQLIASRVILTLVFSLRACHMWLTKNHMFIREIWGKFTSFIFWNFEISLVWLGRFQNFKKVNSVNLSQISLLNMWLLAQSISDTGGLICMYNRTIKTIICFSPIIALKFSKQLYNSIIKCYAIKTK